MNNSEKRLEQLLEKFWEKFRGNALFELRNMVKYPGGFKFLSEHEAIKERITGAARTVRVRSTIEEKLVDPYFEVRIVKEKFDNYTDEEILFVIAHELSHMIMKAGNSNWSEYAADVLAENYFGIKNPKNSKIGYLSSNGELAKKYKKTTK